MAKTSAKETSSNSPSDKTRGVCYTTSAVCGCPLKDFYALLPLGLPMHDVGFVMIDQDLWITFRRFCEETGEEMGMYTERLINIELSRPRPAKPEEPLDSLKLVMLAGNYGELVRTFGAEHVRRCHGRYLGPEPAAVDSRTVPAH